MSEVIKHLRRAVLLRDGSGLSDGQLFGCFIEHRDEAAFAALVRRHGPTVVGAGAGGLRYRAQGVASELTSRSWRKEHAFQGNKGVRDRPWLINHLPSY
jgi:hypothetical protein